MARAAAADTKIESETLKGDGNAGVTEGKICDSSDATRRVFAGVLEDQDGEFVGLTDARRLWYWAGAASLSEMAVAGTKRPRECKFPAAVPAVHLSQVIEVLLVTQEAEKSIREVPIWAA
jgi:hypothetical protein